MYKSLSSNAKYIEEVDKFDRTPGNNKRYVSNRDNYLEEVRRIYVYLNGSTKGFKNFEEELRKEQADKLKINEFGHSEWHFDRDYLWNKLSSERYFKKAIETRRIRDYGDLAYMASMADYTPRYIMDKF